ncbi:hypothetical protein [Lacimicrobium sp. SS2-24]|uniref:hypothetical protein n=1 Tax=Lacimicrobium sp. SS2-24 TaxID=2005569 RepID=UPI0011323B26|nr:hypothetical protein [Lacimicrobium sp. SS2-24]
MFGYGKIRDLKEMKVFDKISSLPEQFSDDWFRLDSKLYGRANKDKDNSLFGKIKSTEKEIRRVYSEFKKTTDFSFVSSSRWSIKEMQRRFNNLDRIEQSWIEKINNAKSAPFNYKNSSDFKDAVQTPFFDSITNFYRSVAAEIINNDVEEIITFENYNFDIDDGELYTVLYHIEAPLQTSNFGVVVRSNGHNPITVSTSNDNTLITEYKPHYDDVEYVTATLLNLLGFKGKRVW